MIVMRRKVFVRGWYDGMVTMVMMPTMVMMLMVVMVLTRFHKMPRTFKGKKRNMKREGVNRITFTLDAVIA